MLLAILLCVVNSQVYPKTVQRIWDLENTYTTETWKSWGVNYEGIYNKERLWIKDGLRYDFYDISSQTVGSVPTKSNPYSARDSGCKSTQTFLIAGNKFISTHANDQYCTCAWSEANPCPHKLMISGSGIDYAGKYQFNPNTMLPVDQVTPDVVGLYGMAQPFEACTNITNPADIDGKWCVVYRGACYFQTKWQMCNDAGAIGTILVMLDDSTGSNFMMWVESITSPMVGITNSLGNKLKATWESGKKDVTLSLGKSIGVDQPDPEYSAPEPLKTMNYYTGEFTEDSASHFSTVLSMIYNQKSDFAHFIGVDGVGADIQVYDMDQSPPLFKGKYSVGVDGRYGFIYNEPTSGKPPVIMYAAHGWSATVYFYNMDDELNPVEIAKVSYEKCDEQDNLDKIAIHPTNRYMYLIPAIHHGGCEYKIRMYDIGSLPGSVVKLNDIHIPEVEEGADLYSINFGVGNVAALSLSSGGISWYDFSNPAAPTPVAHVDFSEAEGTYTQGVRGTSQSPSDPNVWFIQDETEFWYNWHAVKLVDPNACAAEVSNCETEKAALEAKDCDDSDKSTWQAVGIIFIALTVIACLGMVFFFLKWNMEVAFKFQQMSEYVDQANTSGGTKFSDDP